MSVDKGDLHRLIDQLPEVKTEEAARLLVALLRQAAESPVGDEDRGWLDAGLDEMAGALAKIESQLSPEALRSWNAAFEEKALPCTYVPGEGFVPLP